MRNIPGDEAGRREQERVHKWIRQQREFTELEGKSLQPDSCAEESAINEIMNVCSDGDWQFMYTKKAIA